MIAKNLPTYYEPSDVGIYNRLTVVHEFHMLDEAAKVLSRSTSDVKFLFNYQPKGGDGGTLYYWLSCRATSLSRSGEGEKTFEKLPYQARVESWKPMLVSTKLTRYMDVKRWWCCWWWWWQLSISLIFYNWCSV